MKKNKTRKNKASFWKTFIELKKDEIKDTTKLIGIVLLVLLIITATMAVILSPLIIWLDNQHPIKTILEMIGVWVLMNIVGTVLHTKFNVKKSNVKEGTTIGTVFLVLMNVLGIALWLLTKYKVFGGN